MCIKTHFKTPSVSLVSLVQSWHVTPFFASTEPQEFIYDNGAHNRTRHCALRHFLRPDLYLFCLWSNNSDLDDPTLHSGHVTAPPVSSQPTPPAPSSSSVQLSTFHKKVIHHSPRVPVTYNNIPNFPFKQICSVRFLPQHSFQWIYFIIETKSAKRSHINI